MKTSRPFFVLFFLFSSVLFAQKYAVTSGAWDGAVWANSASGTAGEATQPTLSDDVIVKNGVTVTVSTSTAQCKNLSFIDSTATLAMSSGSVLSVAGNFALASTNHRAFTSWAAGAKLRFNGSGTQTLSGWATGTTAAASTNPSTVLMEVVIEKPATDSIRTPGNDLKLAIGKSLDIVSGIFVLGASDDINGRAMDFTATAPTITIEVNGKLNLLAGATHIRGGTTGTNPIGKMIIRGSATVSTTSTNRLNIGNIDIESGGVLTLNTGWSSTNFNLFNPGIITVKEGGTISHTTTTNIWTVGTTMLLNKGGVYRSTSSATIFPPTFSNNGTVRYSRTSSAQTIVDMDYARLEISFDSTKVWTLGANRVISDSLEINNSSTLKINAAAPQTLTVNGTVRLTSGVLDNSDANAILTLGENVMVSRATGIITKEPVTGSSVNVRYTSSALTVTTGPEIPTVQSKLKKLIVSAPKGLNLGADITVNDSLVIDDGYLFLGDKNLTMASSAAAGGSFADTAMVVQSGTGILKWYITSPKMLVFPIGDTTTPAKYTPAKLNITSGVFSNASVTVKSISAKHPALSAVSTNILNRYWTVDQSGITALAGTVEFQFNNADVTGEKSKLTLGQLTGGLWKVLNNADTDLNRLTGTVNNLSDFTAAEKSVITGVEGGTNVAPFVYTLEQNYPNPFNPTTFIRYQLAKNSPVTITVYDMIGREVEQLINDEETEGFHTVEFNGTSLASGVYFYRLQAGEFTQIRKMLLQK
jgi:hypothetical protein